MQIGLLDTPPRAQEAPIKIRDLGAAGPDARAAWDGYVAAHKDASFFHRSGWAEAISAQFGYDSYYRMAYRSGPEGETLVGVLPLHHVKTTLLGSALVSTAFYVYGGILASDPAASAALAADAADLGARLKVQHVELRSIDAALADPDWPVKGDVYATFRREMALDPDERLKQIPRKKRADLRKAIKAAPLTEVDAPVEVFHDLYARSLRDLGTPIHSIRWWKRILDTFGDDVEISAIHGPSGPVTALLSFYDRDAVLPYYVGAIPQARAVHAFDYVYWMQMERAVARGKSVFDFGRSKLGTGAADYKGYWGFEPTALQYQYKLITADAMPNVNPNNPKYKLFVDNWKKLPLGMANTLGPWFARQLA
ncbi:MAG: FemAB family PEP-CTERM system-associated protein [Neomegalonema sp.]|nr:FemAB family PEP-CTERM system-associated protein [Neomegalonema sp.]